MCRKNQIKHKINTRIRDDFYVKMGGNAQIWMNVEVVRIFGILIYYTEGQEEKSHQEDKTGIIEKRCNRSKWQFPVKNSEVQEGSWTQQ